MKLKLTGQPRHLAMALSELSAGYAFRYLDHIYIRINMRTMPNVDAHVSSGCIVAVDLADGTIAAFDKNLTVTVVDGTFEYAHMLAE